MIRLIIIKSHLSSGITSFSPSCAVKQISAVSGLSWTGFPTTPEMIRFTLINTAATRMSEPISPKIHHITAGIGLRTGPAGMTAGGESNRCLILKRRPKSFRILYKQKKLCGKEMASRRCIRLASRRRGRASGFLYTGTEKNPSSKKNRTPS